MLCASSRPPWATRGRCAGPTNESETVMVESDGTRRLWRRRAFNVPGGRQFRHVVKVSPVEEARLQVLATQHRVTIPRLLVSSALSRADQSQITREEQRELLTELFTIHRLLGNMANNVNQVAKVTNATGHVPTNAGQVYDAAFKTIQRVNGAIDRFSIGK